ncbi:MAG: class I SAM-dependent methyltransferase [Alphaproteobacteria bacterium]|nr:class I SAM-dependent methyltransferase [Alphaproteobacteria bacterium]
MHPAKRLVLALIPPPLRPWAVMRIRRWIDLFVYRRIVESPDRIILQRDILPAFSALGGKLLWVGCRRYTAGYYAVLEQNGGTCRTLDFDPAVAKWGLAGRHHVADLLDVAKLFAPGTFDAVLCNGVFGYGVDNAESQIRAFEAMAAVIKPDGWLMLGWNAHKLEIPLALKLAEPWFESAALPGLRRIQKVDGTTHVFALLRRRS